MKKVKLFEEYINEASVTPKRVGRDTGVKLNIKSIKKQLEKDGYVVRYDNDSSMVSPKGINVFNPDSGHTLTIRRNGELFGDGNWGTEVKSEKEAIKALDQYEKELSESVNEGTLDQGEIAIYIGGEGTTHIFKRGKGYYGYNDEFDFVAKDKKELEKKLKSWRYELLAGSID